MQVVTGSGFHSEFLGPIRVGASIKNQGAFFAKLRLKPLLFHWQCIRDGLVPQRLAFHKCRGEIRWTALGDPSHAKCVSLACRFAGHSHQLEQL